MENVTTSVHLELKDCMLGDGVVAQGARLGFFGLAGCQIEHPSKPPLAADRLTCSALDLSGTRIAGHASVGAVSLVSARIAGSLDCSGAEVHNASGPALNTYGLEVGQDVFLHRFSATGAGEKGAVRLDSARIGGSLECDDAELRNGSGPALSADDIRVDQSVLCERLTADGGVVLGGRILRLLSFEGATLNNAGGYALLADGLTVDGTIFCRNGFKAEGELRLPGALVGGRLYLDGAKLSNPGGRALVASRLSVGQDMYCRRQKVSGDEQPFRAEGAVILAGARIGGHLECGQAELRNDAGPALQASGLQVDQDMLLQGLTAVGAGDGGAVDLTGARIGGSLECSGAAVHNASGPGLRAYRLQVDGDMVLTGGFTALGSRDRGAVRVTGARIGGNLDCSGATLRNDSGPVLLAYGVQVGQDVYLTNDFTATGGGREVINLGAARVGGAFDFNPRRLEHADDPHQRLRVDGLTYTGVPGPGSGQKAGSAERWRRLLREGTPSYTAQPYQQLAAGYKALGDERRARQTLMSQRDDQLARAHTSWTERLWGRTTKVTLGYGYQPWRALLFLAGVVVVSCALAVILGSHGALVQTSETATPGHPCTVVQQVSVGLDLNLPVGTTTARARCDLTKDSASTTAAWLSSVGWVLRVLAWVFAALFIAGFTGAVRKT